MMLYSLNYYQTTRRHIQKDGYLRIYRHENLKCRKLQKKKFRMHISYVMCTYITVQDLNEKRSEYEAGLFYRKHHG